MPKEVIVVPAGKVIDAEEIVCSPVWLVEESRKCAVLEELSVNSADPMVPSEKDSVTGPKSAAEGASPLEVTIWFMMMCQPSRDSSQLPVVDE